MRKWMCRRIVFSLCLFATCLALNVSHAEQLLISDRTTSRILTFDTTTNTTGVLVGSDNNLFSPAAMATNSTGDLFVASQGTNKVLRYHVASVPAMARS